MAKYFQALTNTRGDVLPGYRAQVATSEGATVNIFADDSGTIFTDVDGNAVNYATADAAGLVEFYWTPSQGHVLQLLDTEGDLARAVADFADNYILDNLEGSIAQGQVTDLVDDLADKMAIATLAASTGATAVGSTGPSTVQDDLDAIQTELDEIPDLIDASVPIAVAPPALELFFDGPSAKRQGFQGNIVEELSYYSRTGAMSVVDFSGSLATFADGVAPITSNALWITPAATNYMLYSNEPSNAAWATKTNLSAIVAADGPYGAGTAEFIPESTANAGHSITQIVTVPSGTDFLAFILLDGVGRDYVELRLFNSTTAYGVTCRFNITGDGAIVTNYPVEIGAGGNVSNEAAGIVRFGDYYYLWVTGTMIAAQTTVRVQLIFLQDATTSSYTGDVAKGYNVAESGVVPGRVPVLPIPTTSAAASNDNAFSLAASTGYYLTRILDERGETIATLTVAGSGDTIDVLPQSGAFSVRNVQAVALQAYDAFDRSNTSDGSLGTATDGGTYSLLAYPGSYPMVASDTGRVESNRFIVTPVAGQDGTVYAVRDLGVKSAVRHASCIVRWLGAVAGGGSLSNTSAIILFSPSLTNLTEYLPVHIVCTRGGVQIEYRNDVGDFVTLGQFAAPSAYSGSTDYTLTLSIFDNLLVTSFNGKTVVVADDIFREACRYACWEIQTTSNNTTDQATMREFAASSTPVGYPGAYIPAAPINDELPFAFGTATAGSLFNVTSHRGKWRSNSGEVTYAYQWQLNGVDVPGETGITFQTTNGVDEGKTVSVTVTATNDTGSTPATSLPSAALA